MADPIDRQELRKAMYHEAFETDSDEHRWDSGCWIRYKMFERILGSMPPAQPERKTGHWERHVTCHGDDISGFVVHEWICSECGGQANVNAWRMYDLTDFCPNCGACMRGQTDGDK